MLKKLTNYGLYLFVFLLPWQTRWIFREGTIDGAYAEYISYSLYATDILLALLLALSFFAAKGEKGEKKFEAHWLAIGALELAAFISIFVASDHYLAAYRYLQLLLGIGLFYLVSRPYIKVAGIYAALALGVLAQSGLAIWQFVTQQSPANKWLGMAEHIPHDAGVSVVEAMGSLGLIERWMRAYGALPHPNILGGFLALGMLMLAAHIVRRRKAIHDSEDEALIGAVFKENALINLALAIAAVGLFFSFSRSAWLALGAGFALFLLLSLLLKDKKAQRYLLPIILYIGVIAFIVSFPFMNLVEARAKSQGHIERISTRERASSSAQAIAMVRDEPLFGVGIGNYTLRTQEIAPGQAAYAYQPAHNSFLLISAELGAFGFLAFLAVLFTVFVYRVPGASTSYHLPLFFSLGILLYFDHWLWSLHFGGLLFWLLMGLAANNRRVIGSELE